MNWERGWDALDIFKGFLKFSLAYLLWLSALRALLFYTVFRQWLGWHDDVAVALLTGVRFDLLVLAFFWFMPLLGTWLWAMRLAFPVLSVVRLFQFWKSYWTLVVLISGLFIAVDFFFSAAHQTRINHEIWNYNWIKIFADGFEKMRPVNTAVVVLWLVVTTKWMHRSVVRAGLGSHGVKRSSAGIFALQFLATVLFVGLCARGTVTAHHLNREHTVVSSNEVVNQIPVNPIWALDN
jgi:hypothetical protein